MAGFDNNEWAVVVDRNGTICAVAYSGDTAGDQWPGSRAIARTEKAYPRTRSASRPTPSPRQISMRVRNLAPSCLASMPVSPGDDLVHWWRNGSIRLASDPLIGKRAGGVIVFGGGLALYNDSDIVGALGVSGDSSCADHNVAWRVRQGLELNHVPAGPGSNKTDGIIYDIGLTGSKSGFGHPKCRGRKPQSHRTSGIATEKSSSVLRKTLPLS